ncbi:MAG: hypothetical protein ACC742_09080, partial [Thermoanaerobaculales bacterium]
MTSEMLLFERHNEAMLNDFGPVTLTSALLVLLAAALFFRSPLPTLLLILPAAAAIPATLAVAVRLGLPVPPVAICFLAIILGVGIDD